jgi:SNF2 family DNA or RNA helicase
LEANWRIYQQAANSKHNPFEGDAFSFTLLAHTDLSREGGQNNGVDLNSVRWDNYDLVVIDESHNLRNRKGSRYEKLMEEVVKKGKGTKFLLLSATPVNVNLSDLHNQLALFTGDDEAAFYDSLGIRNLKYALKAAQQSFVKWSQLPSDARNSNALSLLLPPEFFHLLDGVSIARSRRQIEEHYAASLAQIGTFPKRLKPISLHCEVDSQGHFLSYERLDKELSEYSLCVFKPSTYVRDEYKSLYSDTTGVANFSQENREKYLIDMMKINFLKRLESSVFSFGQTMNRTIAKIDALIHKLQHFETLAAETLPDLDPDDPDADPELLEALQTGKGVKYRLEHMERERWIEELQADRERLIILQNAAASITPDRDAKLAELKKFLIAKVNAGDTDRDGKADRKVLLFTAFADTAQYLYQQLHAWAKTNLNLETAVITGATGGVRSTLTAQDFGGVLDDFSPRSKNRGQEDAPEIDLLIATDCISEGQNLQDCATVVNFDIHWNPVRLIQRFGRIDRIGSRHETIQMVNFWPVPDLNQYIRLQNRVESRMALAVLSSTGDDNLLAATAEKELCYRDQQLLRLKDEVLDPEEMQETITFSDFTLEEFRLDLQDVLAQSREALEAAPEGIFAVVPQGVPSPKIAPGFLFCLRRTYAEKSAHYPYAPHYVAYISDDGQKVHAGYMNLKSGLDVWKATSAGQPIDTALCSKFDATIHNGQEMSGVVKALKKAVQDIKNTANKVNLRQVQAGKKMDPPVSLEGFELVTWLAIV